ncbi:hypothetical protein A4X09_0g7045 [Tilletia walkeri]|uniref:Glycosyltransferase family 31 protein n=1 Tax=Tilletia walkeri TaxID=117179 RepID=A0A8X7T223_9BASI|nr:hypothetical protein A4X09_0g7045 [Tilletia walkeri]
MSFGGRMLAASSEREQTAYIPLGTAQPREILIGEGSARKPTPKARSRQRLCLLCGGVFLFLAILSLFSDRAKPVTGPLQEFAVGTWDRFATGTSWLAGRPPEKGPFQGAGSIRPLASSMVHLIKSSSAQATERLSWQVLWARPDIPNRLLYSDADMRLGSHDVYDALANFTSSSTFNASDEFQEYQSIHKHLANGEPVRKPSTGSKARQLDKWKLLPMLAHAWKTYPDLNWYVVSEDDTYMFWSTLLRWLPPDSSQLSFYGHNEKGGDGTFHFANVGAGLVLSRRIMKQTFGKDELFQTKWDSIIKKWSCGDCALADVLYHQPLMEQLRVLGGQELFLTEPIRRVIFSNKTLYAPVLSLHQNQPFDLQALRVFEEQVLPTLDEDDGVRYCDLLEHFAPASVAMNVQMHLKSLEEGKSLITSGLDTDIIKKDWYALETHNKVCGPDCAQSRHVPYDATFCSNLCEEDVLCLAWALTPKYCAISLGAFRLGAPTVNVTSGWKAGRIASLLHDKPCKDKKRRKAEPIAAPWGSLS